MPRYGDIYRPPPMPQQRLRPVVTESGPLATWTPGGSARRAIDRSIVSIWRWEEYWHPHQRQAPTAAWNIITPGIEWEPVNRLALNAQQLPREQWERVQWHPSQWARQLPIRLPDLRATLSGSAVPAIGGGSIVNGGATIVITLLDDQWVAAGATFNAQRQNIIDGLDSGSSETYGWNAEVRDKEVVGAVVRTSDTVVTITLTASPDYAVVAAEEITVTVPATALLVQAIAETATPKITAGGQGIQTARARYRRIH